ncbi:TPA: hypothetical protein ENX78_16230 [Candidatus Poribacteria bacterium]|nr:hypothetical protein [Candidatus Poribacteria bacterium]
MAQADFTRISTNIAALNNLNSLRSINTKLGTAQLRLATGKRINQAADDPAGLTIAMKLSARNEGLKAALGNIGDAKNMLSVAEGGLQQINDLLIEMKAKATQAASDTLGADERAAIQQQLESLAKQINDIVDETRWNDSKLLDGSVNKTLQTGASSEDTTQWLLRTNSATATTGVGHNAVELGVASGSATGATLSIASGTTVGSSFYTVSSETGVTATTKFDDLIEFDSGTYKFRIADKATSASLGKFNALNTISGLPTITQGTSDAGYELASGIYKLKIDDVSGSGDDHKFSYTITDSLGNVVVNYHNLAAPASDDNDEVDLLDNDGKKIGIKIDVAAAGLTEGEELNFEYVASGQVKMELYQISGSSEQLVDVDTDGVDNTTDNTTASYFYMDVGASVASYDTGRGLKVFLDAGFDNIVVGQTSTFTYTQAGDVSVDVSTAAAARAYMSAVDDAITKVTSSLNNIGSLTARLNSKEITVGVDQVNTEASYNRIMNADMAYEQVEAAKYMILQQTAVAMLAQANAAPQGILSLFR